MENPKGGKLGGVFIYLIRNPLIAISWSKEGITIELFAQKITFFVVCYQTDLVVNFTFGVRIFFAQLSMSLLGYFDSKEKNNGKIV